MPEVPGCRFLDRLAACPTPGESAESPQKLSARSLARSRLELGLGVRAGCRSGPAVRKRGFLFFLNLDACSNTHIRGVTRTASTYGRKLQGEGRIKMKVVLYG